MGKAVKGRPKKKSNNARRSTQPIYIQENIQQVITDVPESEEILKIIAYECQLMNVSKTGQKRKKIGKDSINQDDINQEQNLQKSSFEVNEQVKTEQAKMGSNAIKQYFLRSYSQYNFKINGEYLIDETVYGQFKNLEVENCDEKFKILYERMNLVARALDNEFIEILKPILEKYITLKQQREQDILKEILLEINNNQIKYQYLLNWQRLKNLTKRTRYNRHVFELELIRKQVNKSKPGKVSVKHINNIDKDLKVLKEQYDAEPLAYFMSKLIKGFDMILSSRSSYDFCIDSTDEQ